MASNAVAGMRAICVRQWSTANPLGSGGSNPPPCICLIKLERSPIVISLTLPWPDNASGVYRITDSQTGKFYIGSSINISQRRTRHVWMLNNNRHTNPRLQAIFNVRPDSLQIEILEVTLSEKTMILSAEQKWLSKCVGKDKLCLNDLKLADSCLGKKRSDITRQRLSAALKGRRISDEAKQKMREAKLGRTLTPEHRHKISMSHLGKKHPNRRHNDFKLTLRAFTPDQAREIRHRKASGESYPMLAREYGVDIKVLHRLVTRRTYRDVE